MGGDLWHPPSLSFSGYTCCLERLHIAVRCAPWRFGMCRAILITDQRTCFQIKTMRDFEKIFEIPCEELPFWIISIVKNESRIILRKNQRTVPLDDWDGFTKSIDDISEYTELVDLFTRLPETYRSVLEMKMLHGYSDKEISKRLGISETAVSSRATRGRAMLREIVGKEGFYV